MIVASAGIVEATVSPSTVEPLEVSVAPRASSSEHHVAGVVLGGVATYDALEAFAWYVAALGMVTLNRGRRGLTRTARGAEDTSSRRGQ